MAAQAGQVFLVMMQLTHEVRVLFELRRDVRPPRQEAPYPDPGKQPDPELDAAGPVHAGQKWVALPPGSKLRGHEIGIAPVGREKVGCGENGELVVPRGSQTYLMVPTSRASRQSMSKA